MDRYKIIPKDPKRKDKILNALGNTYHLSVRLLTIGMGSTGILAAGVPNITQEAPRSHF